MTPDTMSDFPISVLPSGPFNMAEYCIGAPAERFPEKIALSVIDDAAKGEASEVWTFKELKAAVLRTAAGLQQSGLNRGDRILIQLDNTSDYAILFFGAIAGGFVPLPTSTELTPAETEFLLTDSGAKAAAIADHLPPPHHGNASALFQPADIKRLIAFEHPADFAKTQAEDPSYLIYTSGTTARPKGVLHAHRVAFGRRPTYQGWYGISSNDTMLHAGAFNWTYTLGTGLIDPWANGASTAIYTGEKKPELWPKLIRDTGATLFAAVPTVFRQIMKYVPPGPIDTGRLRHGLIAGEAPPATLFDDWHQRTGTELYEALGMSEISTYISTAPGMKRKPGAAGKAQPGRRIAILPVDGGHQPLPAGKTGLIAIHRSDKGLMLGYWNRSQEQDEVFRGEWFIGGDLASMDEDGYITHYGRANDVMKALGFRVSPYEVEEALLKHPAVQEVACTALDVRSDVSVIAAFIVPAPGHTPTKSDILSFAETALAKYKRPREIVFLEALPRTRNGKVQRSALIDLYKPETV